MVSIGRSVKIWLIVSLVSLFIYNAYWTMKSYENLFGYFLRVSEAYGYVSMLGFVFWAGHIGLTARFAALTLGLATVYLLWAKGKPFSKVKWLVVAALFLESVYFVGLLPSAYWMLRPDSFVYSSPLGLGYVLQFLFTVPLLWVLAVSVSRYSVEKSSRGLWLCAAAAFLGYVSTIVVNELSRWATMLSLDNIMSQGLRTMGLLNAVVLLPLALVFAVVGVLFVAKQRLIGAARWFGMSLAVIGLHYTLYLIYSYIANSLNYAPLVDIWAVPLLGLGVAMAISMRSHGSR